MSLRLSKIRRFAALCGATTVATILSACAQLAPQQAPRAPNDAKPALWAVKDKDTTIYLFGTVHVLKPGMSWFDEAVKTAFDSSDSLVLEMVEPDKATQQRVVIEKAFAKDGPPLPEQISADKRPAFEKAMADSGLPRAQFDRMRPWFAAVSLSMLPLGKLGYDPANGPEAVLSKAATDAEKPIRGLETFEGQMGIFDAMSQKAQLELLSSTIDELPTAAESMGKMVDQWAAGDPDGLATTMNETLDESPEVRKALLTDRNTRWAAWISERMKQPGTVFIAVGAGHLAGADSVQNKLKPYKLKATRVKY